MIRLLLQIIVEHLSTVAPEIGMDETDVHPFRAGAWILLPDELVEWQVVFDVLEPLAAFCSVATDTEISGLTSHVLRVAHTAHGCIKSLTAIAAADRHGLLHRHAQWFQDVGREVHQVDQLLHTWRVVDSLGLRCRAGI